MAKYKTNNLAIWSHLPQSSLSERDEQVEGADESTELLPHPSNLIVFLKMANPGLFSFIFFRFSFINYSFNFNNSKIQKA